MPEFMWHALLAGTLVGLVAGPLGSFIVWQRMSFFGDTLAHSALLGVALGLLTGIASNIAVLICCAVVAIALIYLRSHTRLSQDSLLAIIAHGSLALGLVLVSLSPSGGVDLTAYLFGDILAVSQGDLWIIAGSVLICGAVIVHYWNQLLAVTVHPELAAVEGLPVQRLKLTLALLIALLVAAAMKIVGVLLVTALLIIPASSAGNLSRSPEQMAILASMLATLAVLMGLALSWTADTPAGPSMVVASATMFAISLIAKRRAFAPGQA